MSNTYYHYKGQTYQTNPGQANQKSPKGHGKRFALLIVTIVLLAVICTSLGLIIENSKDVNESMSGDYVQQTLTPTESSQQTGSAPSQNGDPSSSESVSSDGETSNIPVQAPIGFLKPFSDENTSSINGADARYAIVIDSETGRIIAGKNSDVRMYPASMTKVMAIIVAYEYLQKNDVDVMSAYLTMTQEILSYTTAQGASNAGFQVGEEVRIHDVFHGMVLPSGADAVLMMANYCAGSETAFVDMMNVKVAELELLNTHFVTSTGLHHDNHYSTASDMAVIIDYACRYDYLRNIMQLTHYTYAQTNLSDQRNVSSTLYRWRTSYHSSLERSQITDAVDFGGKSGYTPEAKYCLASFGIGGDGHRYIVVTGYSSSKKTVVSDYMKLYSEYIKFKAY